MARKMSDSEFENLLQGRGFFARFSSLIKDIRTGFSTINLLEIVGADDLLIHTVDAGTQIVNLDELRRRLRSAQLIHHTDKVHDYNQLPFETQGRKLNKAQIIGLIWNVWFGTASGPFSPEEYLREMDRHNLWDVYF